MSRRAFVAWVTFLGVLVVGTVAWVVAARPPAGPHIDGAWVLDRVQTPSVDQTLHGPADFRPSLGIGPREAYVDQGCGGFSFDVDNSADGLRFTLREQDRSYGPCSFTDKTPGRWDSWLGRVDHAERHGSLLVLTGKDVRLVWHRALPPPPPARDAASIDGTWQLTTSRVGSRPAVSVPLHPATIGLDEYGASIDTGCNSAGAFWNSTGAGPIRFDFDPALTRTTRRCSTAVMRQEHALLLGLHRARQAAATTGRLVLTGRDARLVFRRVAPPDYKLLRNTRWVLEARAFGSVTVPSRRIRPVAPGRDLGLIVGLGDITIESGCRVLRSAFTTDGVGAIVGYHQRGECQHPTSLDRYLTDVFSHSWRLQVDGDTLDIQGYSGRGLVYRRVGGPP